MLLRRATWPLHRPWAFAAAGICLGAAAWYAWQALSASTDRWPGGSSPAGFAAGVLAGLIIVFEMLLWPRRWPRVRAWRIGRTRTWMIAHLWLGLACAPLVILHHGLAFEWGGSLTTILMIAFWLVIASGVFGWWLQHRVPSVLLETVPAESIVSQLPYLSQQMADDAARLVANATGQALEGAASEDSDSSDDAGHVVIGAVRSVGRIEGKVLEVQGLTKETLPASDAQVLRSALQNAIRPFLIEGRKSDGPLATPFGGKTYFTALRGELSADAEKIVDQLQGMCEVRRQYDEQVRLHTWLHGWLCVHLPVSLALFVGLMVHVVTALWYAGIWPSL